MVCEVCGLFVSNQKYITLFLPKFPIMKKTLFLIAFTLFTLLTAVAQKGPQLIIFDTDMGNDVDDALALDLLYKYQDMGKIKLIAIMSNKQGEESARFIDIMNTWYGYPNIPIGIVRGGYVEKKLTNYASIVSDMKTEGKPAFKTTIPDVNQLPDAHQLYRQILAKQADHSVIIISTGFSTNLARLLETKADQYSSLSGKQLIAKKVKYLSVMAGRFDKDDYSEYNVLNDIPACAKLFAECPVPIITSPFELGLAVKYPGKSIENDFNWAKLHPMVEAYKCYLKMPYDRPTWDVTSVLEVLEPNTYMTRTQAGNIFVDPKGRTHFTKSLDGKHYYLTITPEQGESMKQYFIDILKKKPKSQQ